MELTSLIAVVTGASGRVGRDIALGLAREGVDCVCHYHTNRAAADELVSEIQGIGQRAAAFGGDLTKPEDVAGLFAACEGFGTPRILVNSAAIFKSGKLFEVNLEHSRKMLDMNLIAPVMVSAAFAQIVDRYQCSGDMPVAKIVNLADIGGIRPWANYTIYCASKAGLIAATKSMAKELAPKICVNAVAPGVVSWPEDGDMQEYNRQLSMIPAGRPGQPKDITRAVIFLIKNDYITGQTINIDGGRCI